jgi:hypothetical protein
MRASFIAVLVIVVLVVAALVYLLINQEIQEAPRIALSNAKELVLTENFTGTYYMIVTTQINSRTSTSSSISTTSRSPSINALVSNGTGLLTESNGEVVRINTTEATWVQGNEVCQVLILISNASLYNRTTTFCIPSNYSRYLLPFYTDEELLGNATYVGEGSWNGETTYCFASKIMAIEPSITISPPNGTIIGPPWSVITTNATICILGNGVIASLIEYTYAVPTQPSLSATTVTITNETLISYSFTFNQQLFNQITSKAGPS